MPNTNKHNQEHKPIPTMRTSSLSTFIAAFVAVFTFISSVNGQELDFGLATPYAILAGSAVTSSGVAGTVVTGNIGIFPGTSITGFPPAVLNGAVDSANGASQGAQGALTVAYDNLAGRAPDATLSNQDLGGMKLFPGVYKFDEAAAMNGILTLDARGDATSTWTFQVGSALLIAGTSSIIFKDSIGNPNYVYWQVGTTATLATGVSMVGNILALTSIVVNNGATVQGRCLARNAEVTLDRSIITMASEVSFRATHGINGINIEQYNNNSERNSATIKQAIVQTMPSISTGDIKNFKVKSGPSSSAKMFLRSASASVRALSTSSIILNYDVVTTTTLTAEQLQAQLTTAVADGRFNSYLQTAAMNRGATDLQQATSDSIQTETITDEESEKPVLTTGAIIGIAIGGFFALVLIVALVYYFACGRASVGAKG